LKYILESQQEINKLPSPNSRRELPQDIVNQSISSGVVQDVESTLTSSPSSSSSSSSSSSLDQSSTTRFPIKSNNSSGLIPWSQLNCHYSDNNTSFHNLISNCGFEEGRLEPWVTNDEVDSTSIWSIVQASLNDGVHSGQYSAYTHATSVPDNNTLSTTISTLSTTISTISGSNYILSFYMKSESVPMEVTLHFGGMRVLSVIDTTSYGDLFTVSIFVFCW
jgi:hypothetical protein